MSEKDVLCDLDTCSISKFSIQHKNVLARVVDIIDGDTLILVFDFLGTYFKFTARLKGIDVSELHNTNDDLKKMSVIAKMRVLSLLVSDNNVASYGYLPNDRKGIRSLCETHPLLVHVDCDGFDKYGRVLVNVRTLNQSIDLSELLIKEKLAYAYSGATKKSSSEQAAYFSQKA